MARSKIWMAGLALVASAPLAAAQFDQFAWTLKPHGNLIANLAPATMVFSTPIGGQAGSSVLYTTSSPVAGRVSVHAFFFTEEAVCGSSVAAWFKGGALNVFSNCFFGGDLEFDVAESEEFGFGMACNNPLWFADLMLSEFSFTPYWVALGGGLSGSAGVPELSGHGILQAGESMSVELDDAAPAAPVVLVAGFGSANLPFKGGVLVPSPDLLMLGLVTDAGGALTLAGAWPAGVPGGATIVLQAWVADATGPQGFAASGAVQANAL